MMWIRRLLSAPLIFIFVLSFIIVLFLTQINGTLGNPRFYNDQLRRADVYNFVYDKALPTAMDEAKLESPLGLPIDIALIKSEGILAVRKIATPEWLQVQVELATNTIIPYFLGDVEHFTYTVPLRGHVETATEVITEDILQGNTFTILYNYAISRAPNMILQNLSELPYSLTFSKEEIENTLKVAIPEEWVASQARAALEDVTPYILGDSDHFTIAIDLKDRFEIATGILTELGDQKLEALYYSLPECSREEFSRKTRNLPPGTLPDCRPEGVSYEELKAEFDIDIGAPIEQVLKGEIPAQWVYTDAALMNRLNSKNQQTLDDIRGRIKNGYTLTEADIRERFADTGGGVDSFDAARHRLGTIRSWLWALWLIPFAFLAGIGFLGGRNWRSKLYWALVVLFLTSFVIYIGTALVYSNVVEPRLESAMPDPSQSQGIKAVMVEKGNELGQNAVGAFFSGMKSKTLYFMIGSAVVFLGLVIWSKVLPRLRAAWHRES